MRTRAIPWVREDLLDCHPTPNLYFPRTCEGLGLTYDDCEQCPFPACLEDMPSMQGNGVRNSLNNHLRTWRAQAYQMTPACRHAWLIEKVRAWLYQVGLNRCRDMVRRPQSSEMVEAAAAFVSIMETR